MGKMSGIEKWFVNRANKRIYGHIVREQLRRHLSLPPGPVLLELGCGTGHAALLINEIYKPSLFRVTDYDSSQLKKAEETFKQKYSDIPSEVFLETADALHLKYQAEVFDAVFAFLVFHHLGSWWVLKKVMLQGLGEADRVLKKGGYLVYLEIWKKGALIEHLRARGYDIAYRKNYFVVADLVIARK